jgi:hypothetical protein
MLSQFPLSKIGTHPPTRRVKFENFDLLPSRVFTNLSINMNIFVEIYFSCHLLFTPKNYKKRKKYPVRRAQTWGVLFPC